MKTLTPNMQRLLAFITTRHAETGEPVTEAEVVMAAPVPSRHRCTATVALITRGLLTVPQIGTAAWLPVLDMREWREARGMTQEQAGAFFGWSRQHQAALEKETPTPNPTRETMDVISDKTGGVVSRATWPKRAAT